MGKSSKVAKKQDNSRNISDMRDFFLHIWNSKMKCKVCGKNADSEYGSMKICKIENCNNIVWSNGFCKNHSSRKRFSKSEIKPKVSQKVKQTEDMFHFFEDVWKERKHECENCGKWLGNEPLSYMFDHLLEKSKYPELKHEKDNIMLVCLECHDNKTRGFLTETVIAKIQAVKEKYDK